MDKKNTSEFSTIKNLNRSKIILGLAAGKGGVGKSTATVNLGLALVKLGYSVGLLDADIYGPSLCKMLPIEELPKQNELDPERIIPGSSLGLKVISMAHFRADAAVVRAPIANGFITQFLQLVDWDPLDFLLIDFPPGTGDIQLTLMQQGALSGAVIVTTPQEVALIDVFKTIRMFEQLSVPIIGVIENMSFFTRRCNPSPFWKRRRAKVSSSMSSSLFRRGADRSFIMQLRG